MSQKVWAALWPAVLAAIPLSAAAVGAPGPQRIVLNFGPGDGPYISGFTPHYEIEDGVGSHWTTLHSRVALPLELRGEATATFRLARVFRHYAVVEIIAAGGVTDTFTCRGGFQLHEISLGHGTRPATIDLKVDAYEPRDRGLRMDWLRLDLPAGGRVRLMGLAAITPSAVVVLAWALLVTAGWDAIRASALTLPLSVAAAVGLVWDPWLVHRLLRGIPLALLLFGTAGVSLGLWIRARGTCTPRALRHVVALSLAAFLLRGLLISHPDFYYPDQRTHARLTEMVRSAGFDFLRSPSEYIWNHGVWRTLAHGKTYAFPYTPAFHVSFAMLGSLLSYDQLLVAMKLGAVGVSVAPLILVFAFAGRLDMPPWGAVLMLLTPVYTSRLSFAFLPALFGHAVDTAFLFWLAGRPNRLTERPAVLGGGLFLAACHLAYVSGTTQMTLLVLLLAPVLGFTLGWRPAAGAAGIVVIGSALSVALYYRDFVPMAIDVMSRALSGGGVPSRYPVQSFWTVALERTGSFFGPLLASLAGLGLVRIHRTLMGPLMWAWLATYFLLLLGRATLPDIFLHGHETLLVTPLVCLAAGAVLSWLWKRPTWGRVAATGILLALAVQGFRAQWASVALQFTNAL